jgi:hypothetical protein
VAYRRGGGATLQGLVDTSLTRESNAAYDATMTTSGNDILVRVTGIAAHDVDWKCRYTVVSVT